MFSIYGRYTSSTGPDPAKRTLCRRCLSLQYPQGWRLQAKRPGAAALRHGPPGSPSHCSGPQQLDCRGLIFGLSAVEHE